MRNSPDSLMLFSAGFGTRMAPLTDRMPKPLIAVAGKPLIDHALDLARAAGITRIVANLHYLGDQIERHLAGTEVVTLREAPKILDTGGGLRQALSLLGDGPVFTMNTDAVWLGENPLLTLSRHWDPARMDCLQITLPAEQAIGHGTGDWHRDAEGRLTRGGNLVYCGAQILKTDLLHEVPDEAYSLNVVWDRMIARGTLFGVDLVGEWCDVGRPENIAEAEAMLAGADV